MSDLVNEKAIKELLGFNFFIPSYQRGYRWTEQLVKDMLDDIKEFIDNKNQNQNEFYCIQPLVVKNKNKNDWEVIDGQQRLTTIYIILAYLRNNLKNENGIPLYKLEYETRQDSENFLKEIMSNDNKSEDNIDYFYMIQAKRTIENWFKDNNFNEEVEKIFYETLLDNVKFIWYKTEDDPINVFTRLNIGKIPLTNSELIKALFLNKSNFQDNDIVIKKKQKEIAMEWDKIEYTLQNDEFWYFINEIAYSKPTRIDFIFDLICDLDLLKDIGKEDIDKAKEIGTDEYKTFRYFYLKFKYINNSNIKFEIINKCWKDIKKVYQTLEEWYNDIELYHYIGFLITNKYKIYDIIKKWNEEKTKEKFINEYLINEIKEIIKNCKNLDKEYEINNNPKTQCKPLLLLYNIQTIINQNETFKKNEKYKLPIFYKFPFHLYKKEQWDIEHINPITENLLDNDKELKEWLMSSLIIIDDNSELKENIEKYLKMQDNNNNGNKNDDNKELLDKIKIMIQSLNKNPLNEGYEKNNIGNFVLLDSSTNRGYGNAIFAAKRRFILGKDQGKKITFDDNFKILEKDGEIAFVPPCTKNVFLKYYNPLPNNLLEWDNNDATAYLKNIKTVLSKFLNN